MTEQPNRLTGVLASARLKDRYVLAALPEPHNGMGEVWQAQDTLLDRPVIIKSVNLAAMNVDLVRRFRREAMLTARLDHPGVPAVYDLGEDGGRPYLVLQRIDGITLEDLTAEQRSLPITWVAAIGAQISSVLVAAQQIGLIHRDLKPSNVILEPSGAVKVLDFGLAAVLDDQRYSRITQTGQSLGTVGYMAPEQILGEPADHRTDLYGLGGTLFHLLTNEPPFDAANTTMTAHRQLHEQPPRPSRLRPGTPETLDELVHNLLASDANDRPASVLDVYHLLASMAQGRPPIPRVINDAIDAVRLYSAIVGQQSTPRPTPTPQATRPDGVNAEHAAKEASELFAAGEYRAAARRWRQIAAAYEEQHGSNHPSVIEWRRHIALSHVRLGEPGRALRQLDSLLQQLIQTNGTQHPAVPGLRNEIARLNAEHPTAR